MAEPADRKLYLGPKLRVLRRAFPDGRLPGLDEAVTPEHDDGGSHDDEGGATAGASADVARDGAQVAIDALNPAADAAMPPVVEAAADAAAANAAASAIANAAANAAPAATIGGAAPPAAHLPIEPEVMQEEYGEE